MTRVGHTLKDKGHYGRKAVGYTILCLLLPVAVLCEVGTWLGERLSGRVSKLHQWMRPCLYARRPSASELRARCNASGHGGMTD
jgi:hypothetical protein